MTLSKLQNEVNVWARKNFGSASHLGYRAVLGVQEEVGELSHAVLKQLQGIQGTAEQHEAEAKDAVADITIYLADFCGQRGWNYDRIVTDEWERVQLRGWNSDPVNGGAA